MLTFLAGVFFAVPVDMSKLTVPIIPYVEATSTQDLWIEKLADCESQGSTTVKIWDTNAQWSIGWLQFQYKTWAKYKKLGTTKENITDATLQKKVARYMLDNPKETGGTFNWKNCAAKVAKSWGQYPLTVQEDIH